MDSCRHFYEKYLQLAPFESPFSFRKHSTIGCGGEARIAFYPRTLDEAVSLLKTLDEDGQKYVVLGALSNVLPPDGLSDTIVVSTKRLMGLQEDNFVLAGTTVGAFLKSCKALRKSGAEFLVGIPCTLGGAVYMNAGAAGVYIEDVVKKVLVYKEGEVKVYQKCDCHYAYKQSVFMQDGGVILGAWLDLQSAELEEIEARLAFFREKRKDLPKGRSMGCIFKNPFGLYAGRLIEEAGLKGKRIGGAYVSCSHANFILNDGGSSQDVKDLIELIKATVFARFKIKLEEEIRYLQ